MLRLSQPTWVLFPNFYRAIVLLCFACVAAGCSGATPVESLDRTMEAAERGDDEVFLAGLTVESRTLLQGLHAFPHPGVHRLRMAGFSKTVRAVKVDLDGEFAYVKVRTNQTPPEAGVIVMRKEDGEWRLDMVETELLWNAQWALSGGSVPDPAHSSENGASLLETIMKELETVQP